LQQIIDELPQSPTLLPLWRRLARRLLAEERQLLQRLAVFRTPAPIDVWQTGATAEASALAQLLARRLLIADQQGGVALLPALREVIYDDLPVELREHYHAQAAAIRTERGEYTAAAHHLHLADQPAAAVALWYAHRDEEINRGQAGSALALFEAISLRRLDAKAQKALLLIRGTLYQLMGEPDKVILTLEPVAWASQDEEQLDAALLLGKALERNGRSDAALATYGAALRTTTLLAKSVELHFQRGLLYLHDRDLHQAWQEAHQARYLAESIAGAVHEQSGDFTAARSHYTIALTIAQERNDQANVAQIYLNLGNIAMRQQAIDTAIDHYNQAMTIQQAIGDRVAVEMARSLVVTAYMQAARYQEALPPAHAALRFFQAMGHSYWTAINASNLAEIYTELGQLGEAETQALFVLEQEEPHSHPYALFTLGRVRQRQARLTEAELYLDQASTVANMNGDRFLLAYCWEELGKLHQEQAKIATAVPFLRQAQSAFEQLGIANKADEVAARLRTVDA
jgi:tetratricopeptide (TPR) repeat protein